MSIQDIATVKILHSVPGNDWETGEHNIMPNDRCPKSVAKGMTYYVDILNSRGETVCSNIRYQVGSGLTHDKQGRPIKLDTDGVIASIVLDAECGEDTFDWFCESLGYDTDSRSALETYLTCQTRASELTKSFTADELATLRDFASEY